MKVFKSMDNHPTGLKPESWLVSAGRASELGAPLNVPLIPASNFIIGREREYSRDDGTPTWEALEEIVGGLESGKSVAFASAWPPLPPCLISSRRVPLWCYPTIAIKVWQASQQRAPKGCAGPCDVWRWTIQPSGFALAASLT